MGNLVSHNDTHSSIILKLYKLSQNELNLIRSKLDVLNNSEQSLVKELLSKNSNLQNSLPQNKYNSVHGFLNSLLVQNRQLTQVSSLKNRYTQLEQQMEQDFLREQEIQRQQFYQRQQSRRTTYEQELKTVNDIGVDSLSLFGLDEEFSMDELKSAYRKLARVYHPDRPSGNAKKFQVITKAYMALMEDVKKKTAQPQKNPNQLRDQAREDIENSTYSGKQNIKLKGRFDANLFNKIYDENRLHDVNDDGYGDWMKKNNFSDSDIKKSEVFGDKFNVNVFNNVFNNQDPKNNSSLVVRGPPQAINEGSYQEMGTSQISNFGGQGYSDFMEAHTTNMLVDPNHKMRESYKSVDQLKKERSKVTPLTREELAILAQQDKEKEHKEKNRQSNLRKQDETSFKHYDNMHKRMLQSNLFSH